MQVPARIGGAEIAQDRVRFPDHLVAVRDGGHAPVGIEPQVGRIVVAAERPRPIDALERDAELDAAPQHLLHVERGAAPPDLDHASKSFLSKSFLSKPSLSISAKTCAATANAP